VTHGVAGAVMDTTCPSPDKKEQVKENYEIVLLLK
jgi:hypothetical protein